MRKDLLGYPHLGEIPRGEIYKSIITAPRKYPVHSTLVFQPEFLRKAQKIVQTEGQEEWRKVGTIITTVKRMSPS